MVGFLIPATAADSAVRGETIFRAAGCGSCHTQEGGSFLVGGRALESPFGVFYAPNITPHPIDGIGDWSLKKFRRALHEGIAPDGRVYYPSFPYTAYTKMREEDIQDLKTYLDAVPPVAQANRAHQLVWYVRFGAALATWRQLYFKPGVFQVDPDLSQQWNRGAYLVKALAHCGECHTPRDALGGLQIRRGLSGAATGPDGDPVPNITPDEETGIGRWRSEELVNYLGTGRTPDGEMAEGAMAEVIDSGLQYLPKADLEAIADYIMALPPVRHRVSDPSPNEGEPGN